VFITIPTQPFVTASWDVSQTHQLQSHLGIILKGSFTLKMGFIIWSALKENIILEFFPIKLNKNCHANNNYCQPKVMGDYKRCSLHLVTVTNISIQAEFNVQNIMA